MRGANQVTWARKTAFSALKSVPLTNTLTDYILARRVPMHRMGRRVGIMAVVYFHQHPGVGGERHYLYLQCI